MDWKQVLNRHYAVAYDPTEFSMVLTPPATVEQIESLEQTLGFTFPTEWQDLYQTTNGFGVAPRNDTDCEPDLFPSIEKLPSFIAASREAIAQSHPEDARRYIPVLDFINGDTIGYRADDESGRLYMFNHEAMAYESTQDIEEFLYLIESDSLQSLLLP